MHRQDAAMPQLRHRRTTRRPVRAGRTAILLVASTVGAGSLGSLGSLGQHGAWGQTWVNPNTGLWSAPSNWVGGAVPASSSATQLLFNATGSQSYTSTQNLTSGFILNRVTFNNTGKPLKSNC
jgi:hypothetical protein